MQAAARSLQLQKEYLHPKMSWADLDWVRTQWAGPTYVKGVMEPNDAERAVALGLDGIVVSNHGGRQFESGVGALDALPEVVAAVAGRAQVVVDGGVRHGSDIVKALALGASCVLVGRPLLYGLAVRGREGVAGVLEILRSELERTLVLMGGRSVHELDRSWLMLLDVLLARQARIGGGSWYAGSAERWCILAARGEPDRGRARARRRRPGSEVLHRPLGERGHARVVRAAGACSGDE